MLDNQLIVITGASSGIGAEMARQLSGLGAYVILAARSLDKLEELGRQLPGPSGVVELDVSSDDSVRRAFEHILQTYGRVDCLINNAGFGKFELLEDTSMDEFESMMNVNCMGAVRCTRAVVPLMKSAGSGQIVNIASIAGKLGTARSTAYTASKHAMLGFTNALRQELRGTGIIVSAVNPGPIDTPFFDLADPSGSYVSNVRWFMMKPEKVAQTVVKVIQHKKEEVDLPFTAAFGMRLYGLLPRFIDKISHRWLNQK